MTYLQGVSRRGLISRPALAAFGAGGFALFYWIWTPDPSYNSVGLALNGFALALFFHIARALRDEDQLRVTACVVAGAIGMALFYVRPPTSAIVALAGALLILASGGWRLAIVPRIVLAVLAGAIGFVFVISLFVEPVWVTLARIEGGFERTDILARNGSFEASVRRYFRDMARHADHGIWSTFIVPILSGVIMGAIAAVSRSVKGKRQLLLRSLVGGFAAIILAVEFFGGMGRWPVAGEGRMFLAATQLKVLLIGAVAALSFKAVSAVAGAKGQKTARSSVLIVLAVLVLGFSAQFLGTTNAWYQLSLIAFGLVTATLLIPLALSRGAATLAISVPALIILAGSQWQIMHVANASPYLLARPLDEQTVRTPVGSGGSVLRLEPEAHQLITDLQRAGAPIGDREGSPPVLLDLTGAVPGATYLTGATAPGVPWLNWASPGSQAMFDKAVTDLSDDAFASAWVLYAPDWQRGLSADVFAARGRRVPEDYVEVGRTTLALYDIEILILAPPGEDIETLEPAP